jgi:hypothetical protein
MKKYLKILHIAADWAFLSVWLVGLAGCFLITDDSDDEEEKTDVTE